MANKKIFMGMLAAALVLSMVLAGCENGVQEVEGKVTGKVTITYPQVGAPSVTQTKTTDGMYLILSWNAVENAGGYTVFQNQKDKKTVSEISDAATNTIVYQANGTTVPNADSDKWNAKLPLQEALGITTTTQYRFGVNSAPLVFDSQEWGESSIVWGEYTATVVHPYTALLGTWIKQDSLTGGPKFVVYLIGGNQLYYALYGASGTSQLSSGTFSTSSSTPEFNGSYYDPSNPMGGPVYFTATLISSDTLTVSTSDFTIAGSYKQ